MRQRWTWGILLLAALLISLPVFAQQSAVTGSMSGVVLDATGAVVNGAKATLTGPTGNSTVTTESDGKFNFRSLAPGMYSVKVEKEGFRTVDLKGIEVVLGRAASVTATMQPGAMTETVEVTGTAVTVDTTSTAVGTNLPDTFYQSVPVGRNVASLFYVAPGAADGGGTGRSNPSVSGASGLENLYVADGVNITDSAFGGLGVFTRRQGSIGSGINLSFIKEVNVKTSGFEPQYGQADGGLVQLVTKSGTSQYHGELGAYMAPQAAEAQYLQSDNVTTNKAGYYYGQSAYDFDGEFGGPVPGPYLKDHLFFFGSFDPTWNMNNLGGAFNNGVPSGLRLQYPGGMTVSNRVWNYAGKLTWKINSNHQVETSIFGDPTWTNFGLQSFAGLTSNNDTGFSRLNYGTRNWVIRYNGTLSPTWLLNGSWFWNHNTADEYPLHPDLFGVVKRPDARHITTLQGLGFYENHETNTYALNIDTQKIMHFWGTHTFSVGYQYQRPNYHDFETASTGRHDIPSLNATGSNWLGSCTPGDPGCPKGQTAFLWSGSLRPAGSGCTLCPMYNFGGTTGTTRAYVRFSRGDFNPSDIPTYGRYHAAYVNDQWQLSSRVTASIGWRWEQWRMVGTDSGYTFTDNWSPRIGIAVDPFGDRKTKIFGNYARYDYQTPLDAAIRSLSAEKDILGVNLAPMSSGGNVIVNPNGTINLSFTQPYILNKATGGTGSQPALGVSVTGFAPGAKLQFQDEFAVGAEHQFRNGIVLSGRFIYRTIPRAMDDVAGISPEGYVNNPFETQNYFISNPSPSLDLFPNETETAYIPDPLNPNQNNAAGCTAAAIAAGTAYAQDQILDINGGTLNPGTGQPWNNGKGICWLQNAKGYWGGEVGPQGQPLPDGVPDGFPQVKHIYKAVEIELNKSFSHNWMLRANWRIASLTGNYEGAYRNDNGQTDPNISSLFDFTNGIADMLGAQYSIGHLNTDRQQIVNVYSSWIVPSTFFKNTELGIGFNVLSGTPLNKLADHPAYANAGEVPLGGRGVYGRTAISGGVNLHVDRPFKVTEKSTLHATADFFNVSDSRPIVYVNQNYQIANFPDLNPDFLKPTATVFGGYQRPFYARFAVRWVF